MSKLIVKKLYIFDLREKKAYFHEFCDGINIITSDRKNGNNVGKSLIMKSIYHTLGADCYYANRFDVNTKTFLVNFFVDNEEYNIIRFRNLFKIYNGEKKLLYETSSRSTLSSFLKKIFSFFVELPNKSTGELELTPPAFMYLLNYLDQDKMQGSKFASFSNLEQYSNFKERVLYNYFGIYNKEYYELEKNINYLENEITREKNEKELVSTMIKRIEEEIGTANYSSSEISLEAEVEMSKDEYIDIVQKLNSSKAKIISLKNSKAELEILIQSIKNNIKYNHGILTKFNNHKCPVCDSNVDNYKFRYRQYDRNEDFLFLNQSAELDLEKIIEELDKEKKYYNSIVQQLNDYNARIKEINANVDSVIKHRGYIDMKDKLVVDYKQKQDSLFKLDFELSQEKKKFKKYLDLKKSVKEDYISLLTEYTKRFSLKEIEIEKIKDISSSFSGSGSNIPFTTIIWYLTLLQLKEKYNPSAILFPLVLDSPNNGELSDDYKNSLFKLIFENYNGSSQLIISTLGFEKSEFDDSIDFKIVELTNDAYSLLNTLDYDKYIGDYKEFLQIEDKIN